MSYNFKKIIDLDLVNEVPEGANVLIETDGATKRLPSTAIKPAPIQPDFAQNDPTASDYVKNRTHYEETAVVNEPLNITWDGNTEGLVSFYDEGWRATFCKVSDATPTLEQLQSGGVIAVSYVPHDGNAPSYDSYELSNMSGSADIAMWLNKDGVGVAVAFVDGAVPPFEGAVPFPEKGLYLTSSNAYGDDADTYASALTTTEPVEHTKTVVKKLDKKYLPDDIGGGGIKTAIIKDSEYDNMLAGLQGAMTAPEITYSCINMTFAEAYQTMASGEPLSVFMMISGESAMNTFGVIAFAGDAVFGVPCLVIMLNNLTLFWTADGISTESPGGNPA